MKKILIAIPTKNHSEYIKYYFSKILDDAKKYNIDIAIYDSSDDELTRQLVEERNKQGYDNIFYYKYESDELVENKCMDIYCSQADYEYIWLCGDGLVLNLKKDVELINNQIIKKKDIIVFGHDTRYVKEYKEYSNSVEFCKECFAPATWYGAVILKNGLINKSMFEKCIKKYKEHAIQGAYFELFKNGHVNAVYLVHDFFDANPCKKTSTAFDEGRTIYAFSKLFNQTIWNLPECYDSIKKNLEKSIAYTTGLYKLSHLWFIRACNNLNIKIVFKYMKYIIKSSDTNILYFVLVALCPIKIANMIAVIENDIW
ncbi:MAG: hypothetical protein ACLTAS_05805 [Butyribacter sp.]|jgi:hypothetical protein